MSTETTAVGYPYMSDDGLVHISNERLVQSGPRIVGAVSPEFAQDLPDLLKSSRTGNYVWDADFPLHNFSLDQLPEAVTHFGEAIVMAIHDYRVHNDSSEKHVAVDVRQYREEGQSLTGSGWHQDEHVPSGQPIYIVTDAAPTQFALADVHYRHVKKRQNFYPIWTPPPLTLVVFDNDTVHEAPFFGDYIGNKRTWLRIDFWPPDEEV